jgi:hypothetical protein
VIGTFFLAYASISLDKKSQNDLVKIKNKGLRKVLAKQKEHST